MNKNYLKEFLKDFGDINYIDYCIRLINTCENIFTYENLPDTLNPFFLEYYLRTNGTCALINDNQYGIIAVRGGYGTDVDVYGLGTHFIGANCKKSYDININDDNIVMCNNNITMTSDIYIIDKYAKILNEIDKSTNCNIIYSRLYPIPIAKNESDKHQLESMLKAIIDCNIGKVASTDYNINDLLQQETFNIVNLTDSNAASKVDTLVRLKDAVLKDFLREIGINVNTLDKSAQVTSQELNSFVNYTNLNLFDNLGERQKFIEKCNEKFGTNMGVKINELLINQILYNENGGENNEGTGMAKIGESDKSPDNDNDNGESDNTDIQQ